MIRLGGGWLGVFSIGGEFQIGGIVIQRCAARPESASLATEVATLLLGEETMLTEDDLKMHEWLLADPETRWQAFVDGLEVRTREYAEAKVGSLAPEPDPAAADLAVSDPPGTTLVPIRLRLRCCLSNVVVLRFTPPRFGLWPVLAVSVSPPGYEVTWRYMGATLNGTEMKGWHFGDGMIPLECEMRRFDYPECGAPTFLDWTMWVDTMVPKERDEICAARARMKDRPR